MGCVSWPLFIFAFLPSIAALVMPNIWPEKGVRELFYLWPSNGKHYVGNVLKQSFLCGMQPVEYPQCLQNRNICWIFLNFGMRRVVIRVEVYCPFMSTACLESGHSILWVLPCEIRFSCQHTQQHVYTSSNCGRSRSSIGCFSANTS